MNSSDALDGDTIARGIAANSEDIPVEVLAACGSTNSELLARETLRGPFLLLAEEQTAGRGRRGRRWHSKPGAALTFSLRHDFAGGPAQLRGLSLAAGVAIAKALHALGARDVALKWPNDLLASMGNGGAKLGTLKVSKGTVVWGASRHCP